MMTIGVVADTHSQDLPQQLVHDFQQVDLIIHAGDFSSMEEVNFFKGLGNVRAVFGNMDDISVRSVYPERDIFDCEGVRIGLFHGRGAAQAVLKSVQEEFKQEKEALDIIIFGHSHHPFNEMINDILFFNPGSPNDRICAPYCSYGLLEIRNKKVKAKIIKIK